MFLLSKVISKRALCSEEATYALPASQALTLVMAADIISASVAAVHIIADILSSCEGTCYREECRE